jgi:glutathione S-transferase
MIMLFAAEAKIDIDFRLVDLMKGEHLGDAYRAINPNGLVPVLEDGDFRLTESSAILKYLADKIDSPAYPKDLKQRAKVNEMMDWLNSNIYKDFGYGLVYPQIFPHHKRPSEALQAGTLGWAKARTQSWLEILDKNLIGPSMRFLCGDQITIADYFGAPMLTLGETVGCNFSKYANISRWLGNMKALPSWAKVNEPFYGMVGAMKGMAFEAI